MSEEILKACACGARPLAKPHNENLWHICCVNPECKIKPGSVATTYDEAALIWNHSAGDREPAMSKTPEPSTLASATCYTALELMQLMCELRRNMDDAVTKINAENFDHAALCLECAASKLRTIQRAVSAV